MILKQNEKVGYNYPWLEYLEIHNFGTLVPKNFLALEFSIFRILELENFEILGLWNIPRSIDQKLLIAKWNVIEGWAR